MSSVGAADDADTDTVVTVTLIERDRRLLDRATELLERTTPWCRRHGFTLEVRPVAIDALADHDEMERVIAGAAGGRPADTIVSAPPPINQLGRMETTTSVDKYGHPRARSGNIATEFCEAIWEAALPATEVVFITPASWTTSSDYRMVRERARRHLDITNVVTFRNRKAIWGAQDIRGHSMIWRGMTRTAEAGRSESPLSITTHGDCEKYTSWLHTVAPGAKWRNRRHAAAHRLADVELNTCEDRTTETLHAWGLESAIPEDIGLSVVSGRHDEFNHQNRIARRRPADAKLREGRAAAYISHFHVGRRRVDWPTASSEAPSPEHPGSWLDDCSPEYLEHARLEPGWYVVVNRIRSADRHRNPARASAIGPAQFPHGAVTSRRLLVIGQPTGAPSGLPGPISRELALGIETWLTSTPVERATWPKPGGRVSAWDLDGAPWPTCDTLEPLGCLREADDEDDVTIDRLCIHVMTTTTANATVRAGKMAADLRAAAQYPDALVGHSPRELATETAGLAILTCRRRPDLIVGTRTRDAGHHVVMFAAEEYGRQLERPATTFMRNSVWP